MSSGGERGTHNAFWKDIFAESSEGFFDEVEPLIAQGDTHYVASSVLFQESYARQLMGIWEAEGCKIATPQGDCFDISGRRFRMMEHTIWDGSIFFIKELPGGLDARFFLDEEGSVRRAEIEDTNLGRRLVANLQNDEVTSFER